MKLLSLSLVRALWLPSAALLFLASGAEAQSQAPAPAPPAVQAPPPAPPPPTVMVPPPAPLPPPFYVSPEDQERSLRLQEREQARYDKQRLRDEQRALREQHRQLHRVFVQLGYAPLWIFDYDSNDLFAKRFKTHAFTLGALYRHYFAPHVGLQAGLQLGIGPGYLGAAPDVEFIAEYERVSPALSGALEVAPVFGPFGGSFYFAPGFQLRVLHAFDNEATISSVDWNDSDEYTVRFSDTLLMIGGKVNFGLMLGDKHQWDLGFGPDLSGVIGDPRLAFSWFVRLGAAFSDL